MYFEFVYTSKSKVSSHGLYILAVIGFETGSIEVTENPPNEQEIRLVLFTPRNALPTLVLASTLEVTVAVNERLSTATLGSLH